MAVRTPSSAAKATPPPSTFYTVERSALSNKAYGAFRPTGLSLYGEKDALSFGASVFSSSIDGSDNEEFNGWQDSYWLLFNLGYQVNDQLLVRTDFTYNNAKATKEDSIVPFHWALAVSADYKAGPWGLTADLVYGDNGGSSHHANRDRQGDFYGLQVTPWAWILEDKLQVVAQYQYMGSKNAEGIRLNSRYGRAQVAPGIDHRGGRGDSHHSIYGGLNYYLCGHNAKVQAGIEYQTLSAIGGNVDTTTYLLAFRTSF